MRPNCICFRNSEKKFQIFSSMHNTAFLKCIECRFTVYLRLTHTKFSALDNLEIKNGKTHHNTIRKCNDLFLIYRLHSYNYKKKNKLNHWLANT